MAENDQPILLFDTGIGGLSVYDALSAALPDAPVIYAADYAGIPYGEKTEAEVAARVAGLLGRMAERYQPRLVCIACNTASTIALGMVRDVLEVPIVGTVPAIKPAASLTKTGSIALLGTRATIRQSYVDKLEAQFASGKRMLRVAAPDLVDIAEAKLRGQAVNPDALIRAISPLDSEVLDAQIDTVVLACTHFPFLAQELGQVLGPQTQFIDGANGIARRIAHLLEGQKFSRSTQNRFVVTGPIERTAGLGRALEQRNFARPEQF